VVHVEENIARFLDDLIEANVRRRERADVVLLPILHIPGAQKRLAGRP
jgi:hypothetical protein